MKRGALLGAALDLALGFALVVLAARVVEHLAPPRLELGRAKLATLSEATRQRLATLSDPVFLTLYITPRERMPSHLRRLRGEVISLLDALAEESDGLVDHQVVDPTSDADLESFAARRRVSPLRVRHVTRDAYSEQEVWATLTIEYGPYRPARIEGLSPEHLPRLQGLVVAQLDAMERRPEPVLALAAGEGFRDVAGALAGYGHLLEVDLEGGEAIPAEADLLVWLDPGEVSPGRIAALRRFLERGGSAVVAGSSHRATFDATPGKQALVLEPSGLDVEALWNAFGLRPVPGLVLDERSVPVRGKSDAEVPFRVRSIASNQDFHGLAFEPNGNLIFEVPTPLQPDPERLAALRLSADVLASTSDLTWVQSLEDVVPLPLMQPRLGEASPKLALAVWLRPADPWQGSLVALAASTPFRDGEFAAEAVAHPRLLRVLVETLASPDRLVTARAELARPEALPELTALQRLGWRVVCLSTLPLLLAALAVVRRRGAARVRRTAEPLHWAGLAARAVVGLLLLLGLLGLLGLLRGGTARLDLTAEGLNKLHPSTAALAAAATGERALVAELFLSDVSRLPPALRPAAGRVRDLLADLSRAGAEVELAVTSPEDLDAQARATLAAQGIEPLRLTSSDEEITTVRSVWSSLRLTSGGRSEVLSFRDFDDLEFRLAFALWRLATGEHPHVAFASDVPRLSPAEAHEHYQTKGLIAPLGKDEYAAARRLLQDVDFRVTHVDSRAPVMPDDVDLIVWLQPRRPMTLMLEHLAEHLHHGRPAFVAVQHFNVQSRQYRGRDFDFVYWPQPQTPDVENHWFPEFGVELVREVLFDELSFALDVQSQITRSARRDFLTMRSALPFQIRAVSANHDREHPLTRHLGDLPMLWASPWRWDEARLAEVGLRARTLVSTSPRSWTYAWKGGWLPPEVLAGAPADEQGVALYAGKLPLAVLLSGTFPWPQKAFTRPAPVIGPDGLPKPSEGQDPYDRPRPPGEQGEADLLLLGSSEMFKDHRLTELRDDFRARDLLLNAAAVLGLPADVAEVMIRRPTVRGFEPPPADERLRWRGAVLLSAPLAYLLLGALRMLLRRGPRLPGGLS